MEDILIDVNDVSKCYKLATSTASKIINAFIPSYTYGIKDFWALNKVKFQVKRGESVAIIGRNGSGKSTLLEIISGVRQPTCGHVTVKGRVAALLRLGSGFNPEFSGKENIIFTGLLLGLTRKEIISKFDEIIAFAEIGDFIEQPTKNYSSGMVTRLAFSVNIALNPDILIIDESLSVGDYFFKQKCIDRIHELREAGTTILFVSHSMASVRDICDKALLLRKGVPIYFGDVDEVIRLYLTDKDKTESKLLSNKQEIPSGLAQIWTDIVSCEANMLWQCEKINTSLTHGGLLGATILCGDDEDPLIAVMGNKRVFRVYFKPIDHQLVVIQFAIKDTFGNLVYSTCSDNHGYAPFASQENGIIRVDLAFPLLLSQGKCSFEFGLSACKEINGVKQYHAVMNPVTLGPIDIISDERSPTPFNDNVELPVRINLKNIY